ncbi:MAG: hypothetical protein ACJAYU_004498 [Bradymonadia bacterium]|jgi:hypothetical protein
MLEVIADSSKRPTVVNDVVGLIDSEVASKGGFSGMAIKGAYKLVKKLKGGTMIADVASGLLDEFSGAIEPLHEEYRNGSGGGFDTFLRGRSNDAVNALLAITDGRAARTSHSKLKGAYSKLRPMAEKNVADALPGLGRLIDKHCS